MADDTVTLTIESEDGTTDELTVPAATLDMFRDQDESDPTVVGDMAMFSFAQQLHGMIHHGQGEANAQLEQAEAVTMDCFEERFGQTFGEMTGHQH